jgi:hypothetical protein
MMIVLVVLFCLFMTLLSICQHWIAKKTRWSKLIKTGLAICSGITGFFVLYGMLPTTADPQINNLNFFATASPNDYSFYCEFSARNNGKKKCELEKIEFIRDGTKFTFAKSAIFIYGPHIEPTTKKAVTCSSLPQGLLYENQLFHFIGRGECPSARGSDFDSATIEVKLFFNPKNVICRKVPIMTDCSFDSIRF